MQLTSSTWWGFQYLQNSSKDVAQNIIYSTWRGTKGPWRCLMTIIILSCLLFRCFCIFSFLWLNLFFYYSFSTDKRQAEDRVGAGELSWECPIQSHSVSITVAFYWVPTMCPLMGGTSTHSHLLSPPFLGTRKDYTASACVIRQESVGHSHTFSSTQQQTWLPHVSMVKHKDGSSLDP